MMKTLPFTLRALLFIACLSLGFNAGDHLGTTLKTSQVERKIIASDLSKNQPTPVPTLANGQRSLLILVADHLNSSRSSLLSAWLVVYLPAEPRFTFLPIYPAAAGKSSQLEKDMASRFRLVKQEGGQKGYQIEAGFFEALTDHNIWWSGYFLVDEDAFQEITDLYMTGDGSSRATTMKRQLSLLDQAAIYQALCWKLSYSSNARDEFGHLQGYFDQNPGQGNTDLNSQQIIQEIEQLLDTRGPLFCDFPSLSLQTQNSQ